ILVKNLHHYSPPAEKAKEEPVAAKAQPAEQAETPQVQTPAKVEESSLPGVKVIGKINLDDLNSKTRPVKKEETPAPAVSPPAPVAEVKTETPAPAPVPAPEVVKETPKAEVKEEAPVEVK